MTSRPPSGDRIAFVLVDGDTVHRFEGRVRGWEIEGVVRSGSGRKLAEGRWRATRVVGGGGEG